MFAFKARSISEPIADPFTAGTTIPTNAVIFMANNDMTSYTSSSNWTFINMSQSGDVPSQIRGCTLVSNGGKLYSKSISDSFVTSSVGAHTGQYDYVTEKFTGDNPNYPADTYEAGNHTHSVSGLSSSTNLGGKYPTSAVVSAYKCSATTKEIPKNAFIFAYSVQNEDFIPINQFNRNSSGYGRFDGAALISGSSTWLATNAPYSANNGIYGTDLSNITLNPTISTSGDHTHSSSPFGENGSIRRNIYDVFRKDKLTAGKGNPVHTHGANNMTASVSTKVIFLKTYKAIRNTSVYKGMILGWTGTNAATLPKGWYICNGDTINGVTTPALNVDAVISMTSFNNFHGYIEGTDTLDITYAIGGTQGTHSHATITPPPYPAIYTLALTNGRQTNHHSDYFPWDHRHDGIGATPFKQGSYTLNFIIYLG
jgi:hypothetical protein